MKIKYYYYQNSTVFLIFLNIFKEKFMSQVTLKGDPVSIGGDIPAPGNSSPDFSLANNKREDVNLASYEGKRKILNILKLQPE